MGNFFDTVLSVLKADERFVAEDGTFLRNAVYEAAMKMDERLIRLLLGNEETRTRFFVEVDDVKVFDVLGKIAASISGIEETYHGTKVFKARKVRDVFRDKTVNYTDPHDGCVGISQNDPSVNIDWKIDLSTKDWFVYTDNYGTSEEKAFVAYFSGYVADLRKIYNRIYLVRNEREFHIYSFEDGERFEPDYVLFLQRDKTDGYEQLQIFIEPKGTQLLEKDAWKEKFLLQLKTEAVPVTIFVDDNDYKIWGLHFFNQDKRMAEFDSEFAALTEK